VIALLAVSVQRVVSAAALLALVGSAAYAQTSPSDLVAPSLVYLKVDFTPTQGPSLGVPQTDDATDNPVSRIAYPLASAKWPFNIIFVCWEESNPMFENARELVRRAVHDTWESHSALAFEGWGVCKPGSGGIRIHIEDVRPHTIDLGRRLDGKPSGMVLNFTYQNWNQSCRNTIDFCDRAIATRQFGHAIGFASERNSGECSIALSYMSIMDDCDQEYNHAELSQSDIIAVQYLYGAPK
jgi:hypothetical protein